MSSKKVNSRKKHVSTAITGAMVASFMVPAAIPAVQGAGSFSDVSSDAFYAGAVNDLASKGIIGGYSNGTFQPNKQVTRAEAAKILAFDLGLTTNKGAATSFSDVKGSDWFFQPVTALAEAGGINGYKDGAFQPNKTITRAEMASLIVKAYDLKADESATTPFTDVPTNSWYAGAVKALYANKVTTGKGSVNTFAPNDSVTRGEMAVFVQRASQLKLGTTPVVAGDVIEEVSEKGIVIGGVTYTANESTKGILGVQNAAVLKGAKITFEESNGAISKVKVLQLDESGASSSVEFANNLVLEGKGNSVGELVINANYITVKNLTVEKDLTITEKLINDFYGENVTVKGKTIVNGGDDNTVVYKDSNLRDVELNKTGVHFEAKGSTTVGTISALKDAKITSGKTISKVIVEKGAKLSLGSDTNIDNIELPDDVELKDVVTSSQQRKNVKKVNGSSNSEYSSSTGGGGNSPSSDNGSDDGGGDDDSISFGKVISAAGTYGPASASDAITIDGDLEITTADVELRNVKITGDLILGEGIGEGDVTLKGVTVEGDTIVNGGGEHSIHFEDSVLATVIVNKNTGAVRIVATGSTRVIEVQLETPVIIQEEGLDADADGFTNVTVPESSNSSLQVQLIGTFETINSRATNVRIQLDDTTDIATLVLNAAAAVLGHGRIGTAEINADGSTISTRPQNVVLDIGVGSVEIGDERIEDSYSEAESAELTSIQVNQAMISLNFDTFVAGLTEDDFDVTATLDGSNIELKDLYFDSAKKRFFYDPVSLEENIGKELKITVGPAGSLTTGDTIVIDGPETTTGDTIIVDESNENEGGPRVTGEPQTATVVINNGFSGRITDIQGVGVAAASLKFRSGAGTSEGEVVGEAVTDKYGYYSINLEPGTYTGELVKQGYITTYVIGVSADDVFLPDQDEIAIRAAASEEIKIMLTWGEKPRDLDSHLTGPIWNSEEWFHTYFGNEVYEHDGVTYIDLDWDDTQSYGPETTTIRKLVDGTYIFFVHNWTGNYDEDETTTGDSVRLRTSNAKVQIYKGNSIVADETYNVSTGLDDEYYWVVFRLDISNDGEDVLVTPINYLPDFAADEDYDIIPGEINQFKDPRAAIQQKLDFIESNIDTSATTLPEEKITALNNAVAEAEAILGNVNATVSQLVEKLIQLLAAIEPFKDADGLGTLIDELAVRLSQLPDPGSITVHNYYDVETQLDRVESLVGDLVEGEGIPETQLETIENYDRIERIKERLLELEDLMEAISEARSGIFENNYDFDEITSDLYLIDSTTNGWEVNWVSSNESVISTETGVVVRPEVGLQDAPVTLTATFTKGEQSHTEQFKLVVLAEEEESEDPGENPITIESVELIDLPGTEGFLTTGDTIQFTFSDSIPSTELDGEMVNVFVVDYNNTIPDQIEIYFPNSEDLLLPKVSVYGADYVLNDIGSISVPVIFSSTVSIQDNVVSFRLEELEDGAQFLNPVQQDAPTLEVDGDEIL